MNSKDAMKEANQTSKKSSPDLTPYGLTSAMVTALFKKPNDRLFLIQLENNIITFMDSNMDAFELQPMNSYYRLLSYQVAQYYKLKHSLANAQQASVILYKECGCKRDLEKPLLQELEIEQFKRQLNLTEHHLTNPNIDSKPARRFKILKRAPISNSDTKELINSVSVSTSKMEKPEEVHDKVEKLTTVTLSEKNQSLEEQRIEKERQYEMAKMKIFENTELDDYTKERDFNKLKDDYNDTYNLSYKKKSRNSNRSFSDENTNIGQVQYSNQYSMYTQPNTNVNVQYENWYHSRTTRLQQATVPSMYQKAWNDQTSSTNQNTSSTYNNTNFPSPAYGNMNIGYNANQFYVNGWNHHGYYNSVSLGGQQSIMNHQKYSNESKDSLNSQNQNQNQY